MKRKIYAIIVLIITIPQFVLIYVYDNTKYENLVLSINLILIALLFLLTSYLLIVKKSYNILAGMTEELAEKIKNNPEEEKNYKKIKNCWLYIYNCIFSIVDIGMVFN